MNKIIYFFVFDAFNCSRYLLADKRYVLNDFFYVSVVLIFLGFNFSRIKTFSISSMKLELSQAIEKVSVTQKEINELMRLILIKSYYDLETSGGFNTTETDAEALLSVLDELAELSDNKSDPRILTSRNKIIEKLKF